MGNILFAPDRSDDFSSSYSEGRKTLVFLEGNISSGKSTLVENLRERGFAVWSEAIDRLTGEYVDATGANILDLFYRDKKAYAFKLQMVSMTTRWRLIKEALDHLHGSVEDVSTDEDVVPISEDGGEVLIRGSPSQVPVRAQSEVQAEVQVENVRSTEKRSDLTQSAIKNRIVFVERSILTDIFSFAKMLREGGFIDDLDWKIYTSSLREHLKDAVPHFGDVDVVFLYLQTDPEECLTRKVGRGRVEESPVDLAYLRLLHAKNEDWLVNSNASVPRIVVNGHQSREAVLAEVIKKVGLFHLTEQEETGISLLAAELKRAFP